MEEKEGTPIPRVELMRPSRNDYMRSADLFESSWAEIDRASFIALWTQAAETLRQKVDTETLRLATGLLLPIWSALPSHPLDSGREVRRARACQSVSISVVDETLKNKKKH